MPALRHFNIEPPERADDTKVISHLCKTDVIRADMQFVYQSGRSQLHARTASEGFWLCLAGRCRFFGKDDELLATLNPKEGILIPSGVYYCCENIGDDPVEILHVAASIDPNIPDERILVNGLGGSTASPSNIRFIDQQTS